MARLPVTREDLDDFLDNTKILFAQQQKANWNKQLYIKLQSTSVGGRSIVYTVTECGSVRIETYNKLVALTFYNELDNVKS